MGWTDEVERAFQEDLAGPPHVSQSTVPHAYASEATKCARQIAYRVAGVAPDEDDVIDLGSELAFHLGDYLHDKFQKALARVVPSLSSEVRWDIGEITGRVDGTFTTTSGLVVLEIKTMNPKAYERAEKAGEPKEDHLGQAMLSAWHLGAPWVYIPYINKARSWGGTAMQHYFRPYDPTITDEVVRLRGIVSDVVAGTLPERRYKGKVQTPPTALSAKYTPWPCGYCSFRARCLQDGPGRQPEAIAIAASAPAPPAPPAAEAAA